MAVICPGANTLFLKVARCRVSGNKSLAAYICCSIECIVIFAETFLDILQWLNALFANNIEMEMLNFITEPQKIPGPSDVRNLAYLKNVPYLLLNTAKKA